ncbi:hypothetical protein HNQ02_000620 [Flavobacterium sp. 7E]|uniref:hypothetical protein n=1 Tax=Flavobacterium sp. 7E TaxID=2735898 RepID=UPI0015707849|nr:hypothetical protein [Flavobacterium sp. 7E]NRS87713.1 hypothetical protein [Flavobacterium sp. 7E]
MEKNLVIMLFYAITIQSTIAQLSPKVMKSFPSHNILKIYDIVSTIPLSEITQLKIGKKLQANDSLANINLSKGEPITLIKKYYPSYKKLLVGIISEEELDSYLYEHDKKNRLLLALKFKNELQLNDKQILHIREQEQKMDSLDVTESFNKYQFYNDILNSTLSNQQFVKLLQSDYEEQSRLEAEKDWENIEQLKIIPNKERPFVYNDLYKFYLEMNSKLDTRAKKFDAKKNTEVKNLIVLEKQPSILTRYNILTNFIYKLNLFSSAIQYEKELKLSSSQIDALLSHYKELEILKYKDKEINPLLKKTQIYTEFENKKIVNILDPKQINILLINKNKKNAIQIAQENWIGLEKLQFTNGKDKKELLKEFSNYQLAFLVASDQFKMNNNSTNMFKKRDIELKKPELLKQLDAYNRTKNNEKNTKNDLKW